MNYNKRKSKVYPGMVLGRLTILAMDDRKPGGHRYAICLCACGRAVAVRNDHLSSGATRSCGCLNAESRVASNTKHGCASRGRFTREYLAWRRMLARCHNPKEAMYRHYGGRGIDVCYEWHDFAAFRRDMGECPVNMSLDRIDVNGNYEPSNCRWATASQQQNNRRNNHTIKFNGAVRTVAQWSRELGIPASTLGARIARLGWPIERAMTTPVRGNDEEYS